MAKYMIQFRYSPEGARGVLKEGGSNRVEAVSKGIKAAGGKVEAMYFSFGEHDGVIIAEMPDAASTAAVSLVVAATGGAACKTTALLTAKEMDRATEKIASKVKYNAPGAK